jgi:branched-subunit amino acid ABC-type transport system permease component
MRVINFAQGDFLMLGMYVAFYLRELRQPSWTRF